MSFSRILRLVAPAVALGLLPALFISGPAEAATAIEGKALSILWVLPFAGILLSIALMPLFTPNFWHHHYGKVAAFWGLCIAVPFALQIGALPTVHVLLEVALHEYIPFIILLFALFTVAGGVRITGNLHGSPSLNTALLLVGTVLASWMGTTGASMLLIRPLIRANDDRKHNVHVVIFFIFLVSNIGGALTPLGDPPLFLGFLKGVDFFWTAKALFMPTFLVAVVLLGVFYAVDSYYYKKEAIVAPDPTPDSAIGMEGGINLILLGGVVLAVLMSGTWKPGVELSLFGVSVELQNLVRDLLLIAIAFASLKLTAQQTRTDNGFTWGPIVEVAKLFAGIFVTIIPAIAILRAGTDGALGGLVSLASNADGTPNNAMYFWLTGGLSSFLDNAPTYLVFFNMASGDAQTLMGPLASTLLAISAGAVFMGANSYIGNAPNFMVKAIAEEMNVKMPSFFGYMVWSCGILLPCFVLVTLLFFIW
ncbi:sodium:proton antiporter [Ferrovibrio sp.]|uniref:sodium:proton antiporter n=1 Tax=Ferrovibrio sp. TaxID=1917215 RepID=UPI000CC5F9D1|nr:sodium:proton antiporter [Ferrovibrio sp.]PJI37460.1 MAG: sodium:proton antiporter [Ferrovibrio sp.]